LAISLAAVLFAGAVATFPDEWREALLKALVCSGDDNAIYILRGGGFQSLRDAGAEAVGFIDDITNKDRSDCPVAAALTDADPAWLLQDKQEIEEPTTLEKSVTSAPAYSP